MKKIPLSIDNYKELIDKGYYYIDKSLLIKDIVDGPLIMLLARPHRFGKTLNLSIWLTMISSAICSLKRY